MQFKNIKALLAWAFQIECSAGIKIATYGEQTGASFGAISMEDQRYQAAMVLAKVGRLCVEERAALWALHLQRDTEMIYLATKLPSKFGRSTDVELIRKWATNEGPSCRELGKRHVVGHVTAYRYEVEVFKRLNMLMHAAYERLETQHKSLLERCMYGSEEYCEVV